MKISMFKKAVYAALVGGIFYACMTHPAYSEEFKVGYVDSQKVLDDSLMGKQIKDSVNEYVQSRQKIIDIEEAELRKLQEEISKQEAILSPDARQEKEELFQKKFMEYQKKVGELQKEIQQRRTEKLEEFNNELAKVVKTIGEKEGYAIIFNNLDVNVVMYAKPSLNLTGRIIQEMDKNIQKEEKDKK